MDGDDTLDVEEACPLDCWPDELLLQVFSYLRLADLANIVSEVCVRWRRVARDLRLWSRASLTHGRELTPEQEADFLGVLEFAPMLDRLELEHVVTVMTEPGPEALELPVTPLVTERGARLDRNFSLTVLSASVMQTGLPVLLRENAATLQKLQLHDLFEVSPMFEVPSQHTNVPAVLQLVADVMEAVSELRALQALELFFTGRFENPDVELEVAGFQLVLSAVFRLPSLRLLTLLNALPLVTGVPGVEAAPGRLPCLEGLFFCEESYCSDKLCAVLVQSASNTLRQVRFSGTRGTRGVGPLTARALAQCRRLELLGLPDLEILPFIGDLPSLKRLDLYYGNDENFGADKVTAVRGLLARIQELRLHAPRPAPLLTALLPRCRATRELHLLEWHLLAGQQLTRLGPYEDLVVVKALSDGAMPDLRVLDLHRKECSYTKRWDKPLEQLLLLRPNLEIR